MRRGTSLELSQYISGIAAIMHFSAKLIVFEPIFGRRLFETLYKNSDYISGSFLSVSSLLLLPVRRCESTYTRKNPCRDNRLGRQARHNCFPTRDNGRAGGSPTRDWGIPET